MKPGMGGTIVAIEPRFRQLRLETTLDCPLLCRHCSVFAAPGNPRSMDERIMLDLVDAFAGLGGEELTITGGEPLVSFDKTVRVLDQARERGLKTVVFTSGVLRRDGRLEPLSPGAFSALAASLDRLVFTLYSASPGDHDYITGVAGSHALAVGAIRDAVQAGIQTQIHFVPMRNPGSELRRLHVLASGLGVGTIRVIRFVSHGRAIAEADLRPTAADLRELRRAVEELQIAGGVNVRVGPAFRFLTTSAPYCTAGIEELVISSDGRVYPCSGFIGYDGPEAIGNVFESDLRDIWEHAPFLVAMRDLAIARARGLSVNRSGCPAQKAFVAGRITDEIADPDAGFAAN
jgi:radical SAM protein with 4Fe4S-binding SPASM domain